MTDASQTRLRSILLTAALVVVGYGLLAGLDAPHYTYTGYSRSGSRIVKVEDGSPAAAAGLRPGDVLDSVNGLPLRRIGDLEHRLTTGEIWRLVVRRNGTALTLNLTPTGQPAIEMVRARSRFILGLCLVGFTIWAFLRSPGAATLLLAVAGLTFGFLAPWPPYIAPGTGRDAFDVLATLAFAVGTAVVVHFLLAFPARARFLDRRPALWLLYAPAITLAIASAANVVLRLEVVTRVLGTLWGLLLPAYVLWAVALLVRRHLTTPRPERSRHGLGLMFGATLVAVVPFLFLAIVSSLWPATASAYRLYSPYASATFSIIPLAFSVAAVRSGRSTKVSGATAR